MLISKSLRWPMGVRLPVVAAFWSLLGRPRAGLTPTPDPIINPLQIRGQSFPKGDDNPLARLVAQARHRPPCRAPAGNGAFLLSPAANPFTEQTRWRIAARVLPAAFLAIAALAATSWLLFAQQSLNEFSARLQRESADTLHQVRQRAVGVALAVDARKNELAAQSAGSGGSSMERNAGRTKDDGHEQGP